MKYRNGFVSNSSSSSFILRNLPDSVKTWEDVYDFYGMSEGSDGKWKQDPETVEFCKMILRDWEHKDDEDYDDMYGGFIPEYFKNNPNGLEEFLHYYDFCFKDGYGREELDRIVKHPDRYWETSVDDTYLSRPGCAYRGSYITKNGIEINCH